MRWWVWFVLGAAAPVVVFVLGYALMAGEMLAERHALERELAAALRASEAPPAYGTDL